MLEIFDSRIVFSEVPGEISLALSITGCPHNCPGCHWDDIKNTKGIHYSRESFRDHLHYYKRKASCVLFFGGDWVHDLEEYLIIAQEEGFKTALYTGLETYPTEYLDYIKVGPYIEERGPLGEPNSNQKLINLNTGEVIK